MLGREAGKIRSERHSQRRKRFDPLSDDLCGIDGMGQAERLVRVQNRSRKITDDSGLFASIEKQPQGIPENQALPMRTGLGLPRSVCREPCAGGMLGVHCAESAWKRLRNRRIEQAFAGAGTRGVKIFQKPIALIRLIAILRAPVHPDGLIRAPLLQPITRPTRDGIDGCNIQESLGHAICQ